MKKSNILLVFFLILSMTGLVLGADKYKIDESHSSVGFSVKHLVITNVKGQFNDFSGTIQFDENDIANSSVEVIIKTASIDTDDEKRDNHLRSADFFDVENHPVITFKSKKIQHMDDGYVAVGDLTIRGVTKEVSLPFALTGPIDDPWGNKRFGAEASLTINRQDFGISWNKALDNGGVLVGDDVKINLEIEAIHSKDGTN